jgi:hypothetical protein
MNIHYKGECMRCIKYISIVCLLSLSIINAKQMGARVQAPVVQPAPVAEEIAPQPILVVPPVAEETEQPDISKLPKPLNAPEVVAERKRQEKERQKRDKKSAGQKQQSNLSMEDYARNKVTNLSARLVNDIFPKEDTIERMVFEFKDQFPGPNKESDITILYNTLINDPAIKKNITLKNAVPVYKFIKEALNKAWDKKDNLVWSS